jgi:hypothetical protein
LPLPGKKSVTPVLNACGDFTSLWFDFHAGIIAAGLLCSAAANSVWSVFWSLERGYKVL